MRFTRFILLLAVLTGKNVYSQTKYNIKATNYLNNILWSQIFNNFDVKTPILFVSPWLFVSGSIQYIDNDVFLKQNFSEDDLFTEKEIILKEFTKQLNMSFFNYIPTDTTMVLKALYKNRLLYTVNLMKSDSLIKSEYLLPDNETGETVEFGKNEKLISRFKFSPYTKITTTTINKPDSLIYRTSDELKSYIVIDENQYLNDTLINQKVFKESFETKKRKFVSGSHFQYNDIGSLAKVLTLDKNGITTDSIEYFYTNDTLASIMQSVFRDTPNIIYYNYSNGRVSEKSIRKKEFSFKIEYEYLKDKISRIKFSNLSDDTKEEYAFGYNIGGFLMSVMCYSKNSLELKRQIFFAYDVKQNIKTIKVVNKNGLIEKEISYDYDFK